MDIARNRQIKADRVYRTIGKMTWWRVALGLLLLLLVLFMSGRVSDSFASRGRFETAEKLVLFPAWMEKYRPQEKEFYSAGVLYENGEYDLAYAAFASIEDYEAAEQMMRACLVRQALEALEAEDPDRAYEKILAAGPEALPLDVPADREYVCKALLDRYESSGGSADKAAELRSLLEKIE